METAQALKRKRLLESELARYLNLLTEYDDPEQILIFGSLVTGETHPLRRERPFFQQEILNKSIVVYERER